jgi:hypothetical protein
LNSNLQPFFRFPYLGKFWPNPFTQLKQELLFEQTHQEPAMDYQVVDSLLADHEIRFPLSELAELDRLEELVKSDELMKLAVVMREFGCGGHSGLTFDFI